jgi:hypothetical protein
MAMAAALLLRSLHSAAAPRLRLLPLLSRSSAAAAAAALNPHLVWHSAAMAADHASRDFATSTHGKPITCRGHLLADLLLPFN